jgi:hypothetical protein
MAQVAQERVMPKEKAELTAVEKLLKSKRKLIDTLTENIEYERRECEEKVAKIRGRIKIAQSLVSALEKGTLKL